jgi:hypothetical protein
MAFAAASALTVAGWAGVSAQNPSDDGVARLLVELEAAVKAGDSRAYARLLGESADRLGTTGFAGAALQAGTTQAVIHERERVALPSTLPGNGYNVSLDVFQEFGRQARIAMWSVDVKRFVQAGGREWRITDLSQLGSVEDLYRLELDPDKQFAASNLEIVDEDLRLTLINGAVFVSEVEQGTTALVFVGTGSMSFSPEPEGEKSQLRIFGGADAIDTRFDAVFVRIRPGDLDRLLAGRRLMPVAVEPELWRKADRVFRDDSLKSYTLDLGDLSRDAWSVLPGPRDFVAEIHTQRFGTLTYSRSPASFEDVSLFDRARGKTIAMYSSERGIDEADPSPLAPFDVRHYDIDVAVTPGRRWIDGRATLRVNVNEPVRSLNLRLAEPLVVQSVSSSEYGRLFSVRVKGQNSLVMNLPVTVPAGAELNLTVAYAGRLEPQMLDTELLADTPQAEATTPFERPEPSFLYSSDSHWYPRPPTSHYATGTLRISVPASFGCVASGERDVESPTVLPATGSAPARHAYVFNAVDPLKYFAFVVSRFATVERSKITFSPSDGRTSRSLQDAVLDLSVETNPGHARRGRELAVRAGAIARFYHSLLGEVPYDSFTVALVEGDRPGGHSPGYFALLNEPPRAVRFFAPRNDPASFDRFPDFFLAHELAHQWWGQAVGWRHYREQWLSEGFAQYFAALYAQAGGPERAAGDDVFRAVIQHMRKWAMDENEAGPISLGNRLGHLQGDSRILRALVYNKGALVLHMLRRLVGDDAFFRGLRRFYEGARFRNVGTDDFRLVMEDASGRPLGRFFERWIFSSRLPRLDFTYRIDDDAVVLQVDQAGDVFDLPLMVTLHYADGRTADIVVPVTERSVELRVPLAGALRRAEISQDEPPLADFAGN